MNRLFVQRSAGIVVVVITICVVLGYGTPEWLPFLVVAGIMLTD